VPDSVDKKEEEGAFFCEIKDSISPFWLTNPLPSPQKKTTTMIPIANLNNCKIFTVHGTDGAKRQMLPLWQNLALIFSDGRYV
jgi:hypothetical protein